MTPVSRVEQWIALRAIPLLAVVTILITGAGVGAYFIRKSDLARVERIEKIVS